MLFNSLIHSEMYLHMPGLEKSVVFKKNAKLLLARVFPPGPLGFPPRSDQTSDIHPSAAQESNPSNCQPLTVSLSFGMVWRRATLPYCGTDRITRPEGSIITAGKLHCQLHIPSH
jgi:hypothetical protein